MKNGIITLLFIPQLGQNCIQDEDIKFRDYLEQKGFETDGVEQIETGRREGCGTGIEIQTFLEEVRTFHRVTMTSSTKIFILLSLYVRTLKLSTFKYFE